MSENAPGLDEVDRTTIVHPCHPLSGQEVEFLRGPRTPGKEWVWVKLPGGELRKLPRGWTCQRDPDPYELLSERPLLRLEALLELARWVSGRKKRRGRTRGGSQAE